MLIELDQHLQIHNVQQIEALWTPHRFGIPISTNSPAGTTCTTTENIKSSVNILRLSKYDILYLLQFFSQYTFSQNNIPLTLQSFYQTFFLDDQNYYTLLEYFVYQKFRNKFIIKSGHKYGCSFLLYNSYSENHQHAPYCLLIDTKDSRMTGRDVLGQIRLSGSVKKKLLLVQVGMKLNLFPEVKNGPESLDEVFMIEGVMELGRYVPEKSRG